ncbi:MAG: PAS domain-containing protein [Rhodoferax sp.]|nr:PAS domain-containing protein [Rhodoferax sp.]
MSQPVPAAHARADHFADPGQGHEADLHSLAQRERRLDHAEALAGFGTWDWDVTGGPSFWSDRLFVIYGRSKADGVPPFDAWQRIIHPDDREALQRVVQRALAGESRDTVEFRIYTCDTGELRYIRSQGTPRMDAQGRVVGIWGVDQDVTAVRLSHLALQRSEERLRSLTALSADWLWEQDDRYRFTRMDEDRRGGPYPAPSPHVGKTRWELPHVDMDEALWEQHRAQLDRREVYRDFEVRLQAPDGSIQHFLSAGEPFYDPAGRFLGYRGVSRDVTHERRASAALATTARRFQQVLSNLYGGILLINGANVVEYANQGFCDMFGLCQTPQSLLGMRNSDILTLVGPSHVDSAAQLQRIRALEQAGQAVQAEELPMSGNRVFLRDYIPIEIDGLSYGRLWVHRDITTSKQTETLLQVSLREKEALLKEVHHRVKNNLQVITSLLRLEGRRSAQPLTRAVLEDMQGRIRTMAVLHESLYQSGTYASVDLGVYLGQLVHQVFRAHGLENMRVALILDLASVVVGMDQATPCGLILNELVSNSLKHGFPSWHAGEVRIRLQPVTGAGAMCLQVRDDGVGLPPDFQSRYKSSLGLQLVADLARQIDGELDIGLGPGACFSVVFTPHCPTPSASDDADVNSQ